MPPERYGRSTVQSSSFIVTSNHANKSKWGKGYQARLTGANAEVLSMWRILMGIERPFTLLDNGTLRFSLAPKLAADFFDGSGRASFTLFGKTKVTYIRERDGDTFDRTPASYRLIENNEDVTVQEVTGALAERVRSGDYMQIEVTI